VVVDDEGYGAAGLVWKPKWSSMMMRDAATLLAAGAK